RRAAAGDERAGWSRPGRRAAPTARTGPGIGGAQRRCQQAQAELRDYKEKAGRILQVKDKMIATLKKGNGSEGGNGGGGLPDAADAAAVSVAELSAEVDALRQERELLREEAQRAKLAAEGLRCDVEDLEAQMQSESETFRKTMSGLEAQLESERLARLAAEEEAQRDLWLRDKSELSQRLAQAEAELDALRRQSAPQLLRSGAGTSVASGGQDGGELEARIRSLTESLIQKQTALESSNAEKASLRLMVEQLESRLSERTITPRRLPRSRACRPDLRRRPMNTLDKAGVKLGVFLRRYPMARMLFLAYIGLLHLWVIAVAMATPAKLLIGERFDGNGNLQDPVSAVAVPSFSLMTDCADNLIDSSASKSFLPSPTSTSARTDDDSGGGAAEDESFDAEDAVNRLISLASPSANGGNIGIELLLSAGSELVAASAEFCLCANCGLCCQGAGRGCGRIKPPAAIWAFSADHFDTFKCRQCGGSVGIRQACSATSLCTVMKRYQKKRAEDDGAACGCGCGGSAERAIRPFDCAYRPFASSKASAVSAEAGSSSSTVEAGRAAAGAVRKLFAPSPVVTLGPSEQLSVCLQCTAWTAGVVAQNEHATEDWPLFVSDCSAPERRQRRATCYKCLLCHQRHEHAWFSLVARLFATWQMGPPPGRSCLPESPALPKMRPGESHLALLIVALAEESAAADMASRSLQLALPRQNLGLPYSVESLGALRRPAAASQTRRIAGRVACQKPILLPDGQASHAPDLQTVCITAAVTVRPLFPYAKSSDAPGPHRDADHSTTTLPRPVKRRRRSIVDFWRRRDANGATPGDDRLLLLLHVWRRIHQLVGAEVALSFGHPVAAGEQLA
uniref:Golgin-84 n=1 Tax=Macrostomum lignano TaxID=282301 RepID=A0A1I8F834_9PLAT